MWKRHAQILGLLLCTLGCCFVGCTVAMDHWRVAQLGGEGGSSVVVTAWYWSDLWRDCYEDSTAVVNCVDFGVLWMVKSYILVVRALLFVGLSLGLFGTVLTFFGMECTRLSSDPKSKDRMLITASALHLMGCVSDLTGYCLYINRVVEVFLHVKADPAKLSYDIGPPLYLGIAGSFLIFLGCIFKCATARGDVQQNSSSRHPMILFMAEKGEETEIFRGYKHRLSDGFRNTPSYKMASVVTV